MRSRSDIVGADTTVAPGIDGDRDGAHSLQTTPRTNCGGTAGEEGNVSDNFYVFHGLSLSFLFQMLPYRYHRSH